MALYIGIEACNKDFTVIAVADKTGEVKYAERAPVRLNYYEMSSFELSAELYKLIKDGLQACGQSVSEFCRKGGGICVGITGVTNRYDREIGMKEVWEGVSIEGAKIITTGGIEIAFTGATRRLTGAAITSRAGSAALARTEKTIKRVGGWGPLLGDEGSGYWIGCKVLNTLCRLKDGRLASATRLPDFVLSDLDKIPIWKQITSNYDCDNDRWINALLLLSQRTINNREFRYIVSEVAKSVFKTAEQYPNDEIAFNLALDAANELIEQVDCAMRKADLPHNDAPLVLRGGIFRYNPFFSGLVREKAIKKWPSIRVILQNTPDVMRPVIGALTFALSGGIFTLPTRQVIERLEESSCNYPALNNDLE